MKVRACAHSSTAATNMREPGGDLLVIRGGRLALLGTQRSLEANTTVEALDARWMPGRV
jgi:hypothetical protein